MKHLWKLVLGLLVLVILLAYTISYQVRYNELAVVTTFGRAGENAVRDGRTDDGAGYHLKWFYPVQDVTKYDARVQVFEDRLEQQQTKDKRTLAISTFVYWRIDKPLDFYRSLFSVGKAEEQLRNRMRTAAGQLIGERNFDELTNENPDRLKLPEIEAAILRSLREGLASQNANYGIVVESVGIRRTVFPASVTPKVNDAMTANRQKLAQQARDEGTAAKTAIEADADSKARQILAFADRRGRDIVSQGQAEVATSIAVLNQDPEFAIFLRKLEEFGKTLSVNTMFIIDAKHGIAELFNTHSAPSSSTRPSLPVEGITPIPAPR